MDKIKLRPTCWEAGECFAKTKFGRCRALDETDSTKDCSFRKPMRHITNGKSYTKLGKGVHLGK